MMTSLNGSNLTLLYSNDLGKLAHNSTIKKAPQVHAWWNWGLLSRSQGATRLVVALLTESPVLEDPGTDHLQELVPEGADRDVDRLVQDIVLDHVRADHGHRDLGVFASSLDEVAEKHVADAAVLELNLETLVGIDLHDVVIQVENLADLGDGQDAVGIDLADDLAHVELDADAGTGEQEGRISYQGRTDLRTALGPVALVEADSDLAALRDDLHDHGAILDTGEPWPDEAIGEVADTGFRSPIARDAVVDGHQAANQDVEVRLLDLDTDGTAVVRAEGTEDNTRDTSHVCFPPKKAEGASQY